MSITRKIWALLLAALLVITACAVAVLAEPEPESQEPGTETSEESSNDPNAFHIMLKINGDAESALCYFDSAETAAAAFSGTGDANVAVLVAPAEGYKLTSVKMNGIRCAVSESGESAFDISATSSESYTITVATEKLPEPVVRYTLTVNAAGVNGTSVNGEVYSEPLVFDAGSAVSVVFDTGESFVPSDAVFDVNGTATAIESGQYEFTITEDTVLTMKYQVVSLLFKITGLGTIKVGTHEAFSNSNANSQASVTYDYAKGEVIAFTIAPAAGNKISSVMLNGVAVTASAGTYSTGELTANAEISVTFTADGVTPPVKQVPVIVFAGANGTVQAGGITVTGGSGSRTINVNLGETLNFTVTPAAGYTVDYFKIGDAPITLVNGTYSLINIADSTDVSVAFKLIEVVPEPDGFIGNDDINWQASPIIVDISKQTLVKKEVFEKIASLSSGSSVSFNGLNCIITVPGGTSVTFAGDTVNLSVAAATTGATYNLVNGLIAQSTGADILFRVFEFPSGITFPQGTTVAFNLGTDFAGGFAMMLVYNSAENKLDDKETAQNAIAVAANGWSGKYPYDNEGFVVCTKNIAGQYSIEATAGVGGIINPAGTTSVNIDDDRSFEITANADYVIKRIYVDGTAITEAEGKTSYVYAFTNVGDNHIISAEFVLAGDFSKPAAEDNGNTSLIVTLIVAFIAVAGAAALFIVKWRQEKF